MNINLEGIVIIVGNYGSGKTEVAINLAVERKHKGLEVRIADLDLVNPYFRTREARGLFSDLDIDLVLPPEKYMNADLPILTPAVAGMIRHPSQFTLIDVGGDDVGATVLSSLAESLAGKKIRMLQVVNPFRPFTETIEGCLKVREEIESASRLNINGLSEKSRLPLEFITASVEYLGEIEIDRFSCPVLPIARQLVPPWKKAEKISFKN